MQQTKPSREDIHYTHKLNPCWICFYTFVTHIKISGDQLERKEGKKDTNRVKKGKLKRELE